MCLIAALTESDQEVRNRNIAIAADRLIELREWQDEVRSRVENLMEHLSQPESEVELAAHLELAMICNENFRPIPNGRWTNRDYTTE